MTENANIEGTTGGSHGIAIVTPSFVRNAARSRMAAACYASLRAQVGDRFPFYVVDDTPDDMDRRRGWIDRLRPYVHPRSIYADPCIRFLRGPGKGATAATLQGVQQARREGARHIFLHMDDATYNDVFPKLLLRGADALDRDAEILYIRTGGYPLLSEHTKPKEGNRSLVRVEGDRIRFDTIELRPERRPGYTLWWSHFTGNANQGNFWPLPLYHALFRADRLEEFLAQGIAKGERTLGDVETRFKDARFWPTAKNDLRGKFGYIDFQYGGLEVHRTNIWGKIDRYVNEPIL